MEGGCSMLEEARMWGIHTQDDTLFLQGNVIAIGWREIGDLSIIDPDRESFRKQYFSTYPDSKKGSVATSSGMLFRFVHEIQIGDYVVFPSKTDRMINIGIVEGRYQFVPDAIKYTQQRSVRWIKHLPRTMFSQGALYEIGSALTLFAIKNYTDEFFAALDVGFKKYTQTEDESIGATAEEIIESTRDFILKEISRQLKGYDLEEFVADLLQAMGYRTIISPRGGDSGIDITAYKDELPPRILVQVKPGWRYQGNYHPIS
jgi:restriction system protein